MIKISRLFGIGPYTAFRLFYACFKYPDIDLNLFHITFNLTAMINIRSSQIEIVIRREIVHSE